MADEPLARQLAEQIAEHEHIPVEQGGAGGDPGTAGIISRQLQAVQAASFSYSQSWLSLLLVNAPQAHVGRHRRSSPFKCAVPE